MKWIFLANNKTYDLANAIRFQEIGFEQNNYKVEVGDIVYLYETKKDKFIRFKCVVTSVNNAYTVTDERRFGGWALNEPIFNFTVSLDYEFTKPITFKELSEHGISRKRINITKSERFPEVFEFLSECEIMDRESKSVQPDPELVPLLGEERIGEVKQRIHQTDFRDKLIKRYGKCSVCGNDEICLLSASHIKPWRNSDAKEKVDINNGLLLCPAHDKCFDLGLISFDHNGKIMISSKLSKENRKLLNILPTQKITMSDEIEHYMVYHRNHVFQNSQ